AHDQPRVMQQRRARGGGEHAGRLALEQLDVEIELEVGQPLADRRRRQVLALRCPREAGLLDDGNEQPKRNEVDARHWQSPRGPFPGARRVSIVQARRTAPAPSSSAQGGSPIGNGAKGRLAALSAGQYGA